MKKATSIPEEHRNRPDVKAVAEDIDTYATLAGFASSEAGDVILAALRKEIAGGVETLLNTYKTAQEVELRSAIAGIEARVGLVKSLTRSATNLADAQSYLDELLK